MDSSRTSAPPPTAGITLGEVLELDLMRRTGPELVHGADQLERRVRWVHTSELAEVPSLLKGGELLLTTGLGLEGRGPAAIAAYVHALADKDVTALALELGWSFAQVPDAMRDAARERDLPLIALHEIVPFVEITEDIGARIVSRQAARLEHDRDVQRLLQEVLLRDEGLAGVLGALAQVTGGAVTLETAAGEVVAGAGEAAVDASAVAVPVEVLGEAWGRLRVAGPAGGSADLARPALEHGAATIALTLLRGRRDVPLRQRLCRDLFEDMLAGRFRSARDLEARAGLLGVNLAGGRPLVAVALAGFAAVDGEVALQAATRAVEAEGGGLVAGFDAEVLGVLAAPRRDAAQALAETLLARADEVMERRGATRAPRLALGPVVHGAEQLGRSLRDAQATLQLARELGTGPRAVTSRGLAAERLLASLGEPQLAALVEEELGPVLRHDADHGSRLEQTLWAYVASSDSKSALAAALRVRRQSLYHRLARIDELLGGGLDEPDRRLTLMLALKANDMRRRRERAARTGGPADGDAPLA
jgi:purine catabolism regulator